MKIVRITEVDLMPPKCEKHEASENSPYCDLTDIYLEY